ncbi:MAG: sulfoxide reductase heme-binding subunit YedZ [Anaerolineales bacterium]|nr:MAG: sulfoxide reductase heme-binding subunit YedZ [Anaerolineales bacterium]
MRLLKLSPFQWIVHLGALTPLVVLILDALRDNLTVNPIQDITFRTGKTALVLLVLSLAATPINTMFGFRPALKVRRALGLYAFLYVSLHFLIFIGLDYAFDQGLIYEAILEKRYALVGFAAGLVLLPLAITSTKGWMKRLGKNWKRLHRLVYLAALLAAVHYIWLVKSDIREPLIFSGIIIILLVLRIPFVRRRVTNRRLIVRSRITGIFGKNASQIIIEGSKCDIKKQKA